MVVPTCHGYDPDTLYPHGSVASQSLNMAGPVCVTITRIDGLVLARSVFEHTINYRSAMIYGQPRLVTDPAEWPAGLRCITEHASLAAGDGRSGHRSRAIIPCNRHWGDMSRSWNGLLVPPPRSAIHGTQENYAPDLQIY